MFEVPRIYTKGMEFDHDKEMIITQEVDIGGGKKKKLPYLITRKYMIYLLEEKIAKLEIEHGENQAYIEELEERNNILQSQVENLKKNNSELRSGAKQSELVQNEKKKTREQIERNSFLKHTISELVSKVLKLERENEELKKRVGA